MNARERSGSPEVMQRCLGAGDSGGASVPSGLTGSVRCSGIGLPSLLAGTAESAVATLMPTRRFGDGWVERRARVERSSDRRTSTGPGCGRCTHRQRRSCPAPRNFYVDAITYAPSRSRRRTPSAGLCTNRQRPALRCSRIPRVRGPSRRVSWPSRRVWPELVDLPLRIHSGPGPATGQHRPKLVQHDRPAGVRALVLQAYLGGFTAGSQLVCWQYRVHRQILYSLAGQFAAYVVMRGFLTSQRDGLGESETAARQGGHIFVRRALPPPTLTSISRSA